MLRDLGIAAAIFAAGVVAGFFLFQWQDPTRSDIAEDLAQTIAQELPDLEIEKTEESQTGPVVYVAMGRTNPDSEYRGLARIEIGYEGQYLPSIWSQKTGYYDYHWNKAMSEDDLMKALRLTAQERSKE